MGQTNPAVIIGPSGSGKTSLVALLAHAAPQQARDDRRLECEFRPINDHMKSKAKDALDLVVKGGWALSATHGLDDFEFDFRVRRKDRSLAPAAVKRFVLKDSEGGLLFADSNSDKADTRSALIEAVAMADGIIICADATNTVYADQSYNTAQMFVAHFPSILAGMGRRKLRCERIVFCLTKAERLVADYKHGAMRRLETADAAKTCRRLIGDANINLLKSYLRPDAEVMAGWSSIYGFDMETGKANFEGDGNRTVADRAPNSLKLRPFRLHEPFVFLTTGEPMNLQSLFTADEKRERQIRRWFGVAGRRVEGAKSRIDAVRGKLDTELSDVQAGSTDDRGTWRGPSEPPPEASVQRSPSNSSGDPAASSKTTIRPKREDDDAIRFD